MKVIVAVSVAALLASSSEAAVWDVHKTLVCKSEKSVGCDILTGTCDKRDIRAVWQLDFVANKLTYLGGKMTETIVAKTTQTYAGKALSNAIFLSSDRAMRFYPEKHDPAMGVLIPAVLMESSLDNEVVGTQYECSPDF